MSRSAWVLGWQWLLFSPLATSCFVLDQTALVTRAALLLILSRDFELNVHPTQGPTSDWPATILFWALTAKPPLMLTTASALVVALVQRGCCHGSALVTRTSTADSGAQPHGAIIELRSCAGHALVTWTRTAYVGRQYPRASAPALGKGGIQSDAFRFTRPLRERRAGVS
jgi:hypothetical protein